MKVIWLYYLALINPYKFMSGYLHFPYNLKVYQCKFENLSICSNSYKDNTLKISHS